MFIVAAVLVLVIGSDCARAQTDVAPTSQPSAEQAKSFYDQMLKTQLVQIMEGKQELTWARIRQPDFWIDTVKDLIVTLIAFVPRVIGTVIFLFVFWLIYRGIRRVAVGNMKQQEVDSSIRDLLGGIIKWGIMGFGVVIACNQLGIPIVAMLTGVSIIGLAVGFAAQETLANFIAGIVIFLDKPCKVGDWVELEGTFGQIKRITFRSTRLLTLDGEVHVFPNTHVLSNKLANHSANPLNRVSIPIGIAYKESIDEARKVLLNLTCGDERISREPAPEVVVSECAESSVNLLLRLWIHDESVQRRIVYEYTEKAKNALDSAGIEIPFPHMQLLVEQTPAILALAGTTGRRAAG
jgi:small conductance mechanosensitive channel